MQLDCVVFLNPFFLLCLFYLPFRFPPCLFQPFFLLPFLFFFLLFLLFPLFSQRWSWEISTGTSFPRLTRPPYVALPVKMCCLRAKSGITSVTSQTKAPLDPTEVITQLLSHTHFHSSWPRQRSCEICKMCRLPLHNSSKSKSCTLWCLNVINCEMGD